MVCCFLWREQAYLCPSLESLQVETETSSKKVVFEVQQRTRLVYTMSKKDVFQEETDI